MNTRKTAYKLLAPERARLHEIRETMRQDVRRRGRARAGKYTRVAK